MSADEMTLARWQLWLLRAVVLLLTVAAVVGLYGILILYGAGQLLPGFESAISANPAQEDPWLLYICVALAVMAFIEVSPFKKQYSSMNKEFWPGSGFWMLLSLWPVFGLHNLRGVIDSYVMYSCLVLFLLSSAMLLILIVMHPWQEVPHCEDTAAASYRRFRFLLWALALIAPLALGFRAYTAIWARSNVAEPLAYVLYQGPTYWYCFGAGAMVLYSRGWRWQYGGAFAREYKSLTDDPAVDGNGESAHAH